MEIASIFRRFWSGGVEALLRLEDEGTQDWWLKDSCREWFRKVALDLQSRGLVDFTPNSEIAGEAEFAFRRGSDSDYLLSSIRPHRRQRYQRAGGRWLLERAGNGGDGALQGQAGDLLHRALLSTRLESPGSER